MIISVPKPLLHLGGFARNGGTLCLALLTAGRAEAQTPSPPPAESRPAITVTSRVIVVPTLVRTASGDLVHLLTAKDFSLLDNGRTQAVVLDTLEHQPVALVVVLQTGGAAVQQVANYAQLPSMLAYLAGNVPLQVALETFDSQPEEEWSFAAGLNDLEDDLTHPQPGNSGAAILDAVDHGISMLASQPPGTRRVLLLLSQPQDHGSHVSTQDVVRRLGENDVTILSATFSPEKAWLKDQFTKPRHGEKPYPISPGHAPLLYTFSLSTPLRVALRAMRTNAAEELASLSGGEYMPFQDRRSLESGLATLANHLPNRYLLSFRPSSDDFGFHLLEVRVAAHPELKVSARTGYWSAQNIKAP